VQHIFILVAKMKMCWKQEQLLGWRQPKKDALHGGAPSLQMYRTCSYQEEFWPEKKNVLSAPNLNQGLPSMHARLLIFFFFFLFIKILL